MLGLVLPLAVILLAGPVAFAQPYPARAVTIIVPYTPGTTADTLARVLGTKLAERLNVAVVTENRPGASGIIGTEAVAKSPADGHTILFTATAHGTVPALNRKMPFDTVKAFSPVILLGTSAMALVVAPQWPVNSVAEFIAAAKREPGRWNYSSTGSGAPQHLTMELLKQEFDVNLVHVPYKGSAGALADVVAGHVQASIASLQTAMSFVQAGKLRMLAVLSAERSASVPNVPTLRESGQGDLVVETWYGAFAPSATPASVISRLNSELNTLLLLADVREQMARQGVNPAGGEPVKMDRVVREEIARWTRVVDRAKITAN